MLVGTVFTNLVLVGRANLIWDLFGLTFETLSPSKMKLEYWEAELADFEGSILGYGGHIHYTHDSHEIIFS